MQRRTKDGVKTYKWCGTCNRGTGSWNLTHVTAEHKAGVGKRGPKPEGNNVEFNVMVDEHGTPLYRTDNDWREDA